MKRLWIATAAATLFGCSCAFAQVGGIGTTPLAPLGVTSPLGLGPGAAVGPIGIPLGATELGTPGVSPMISATSPLGSTIGNFTACPGMGLSPPQTSSGMPMSSGSCAGTTDGSGSQAAASASSPGMLGSRSTVGRVGIPLGSTELGFAGLSPPPTAVIPNPSFPSSVGTSPSFPTSVVPSPPVPATTGANPSLPATTAGSALSCNVTGVSMSAGVC
jgi:hypothetical protein